MTKKLLPCPFCGGKVTFTEDEDGYDIECKTMGCFMQFGAGSYSSKEKLRNTWNRRSKLNKK